MQISGVDIRNSTITVVKSGQITISGADENNLFVSANAGEAIVSGQPVGLVNNKIYPFHEWRNRLITTAQTLFAPGGDPTANTLRCFPLQNDPDKFITIYHRSSTVFATVCQLSGDAVVAGSVFTMITSAGDTNTYTRIVPYSNSRYFIVHTPVTGINGIVRMFDVSGLEITGVGSQTSLGKSGAYLCDVDTDKWILTLVNSGSNATAYTLTWNPGVNTWSVGANGPFIGGDTDNEKIFAFKSQTNEFYSAGGNGFLYRNTVSGSVVSAGGSVAFSSGFNNAENYIPFIIKNKSGSIVALAYQTLTTPDFGSVSTSVYRFINSGTVTLGGTFYDKAYAGNPHNKSAGTNLNTTSFSTSSLGIMYDESDDTFVGLVTALSTLSVTASNINYFPYRVIMDRMAEPVYAVFVSDESTNLTTHEAILRGSNNDRLIQLYYNGSNIRYSIMQLYRPSQMLGIAENSANSGEAVNVIVRGQYTLPAEDNASKGKFLQIYNGQVFASKCQYRSFGIHAGDRYLITGTDENYSGVSVGAYQVGSFSGVEPNLPDSIVSLRFRPLVPTTERLVFVIGVCENTGGGFDVFSTIAFANDEEYSFYFPRLPAGIRTVIPTGTVGQAKTGRK